MDCCACTGFAAEINAAIGATITSAGDTTALVGSVSCAVSVGGRGCLHLRFGGGG